METTTETAAYTTTVFDGDPSASGPCSWPHWEGRSVDGRSPTDILNRVLTAACEEAEESGEYEDGDRLWAIVWDADGTVAAKGSRALDLDED